MQATPSSYPATFTFDPPEKVANWRPLVHWILAIPHFVVLWALGVAAEVLAVISWFAILFTGKLPAGIANFQAMYLRYQMRTTTYAIWMREEYPPFGFDMTSSDPGNDARVRVDIQPALEGRNRLTTFFRIFMIIPHVIVYAFLAIAAVFVVFVSFFAVLFTGKWPTGMLNFVLGVSRWQIRLMSYALMLNDEYPPFSTA